MMKRCGCTPGTEANGWHETRSDKCLAKEKEAFSKVIGRYLRKSK